MKKVTFAIGLFVLFASIAIYKASAGGQYNWGTSSGSSWVTPDDTTLVKQQVLVVSSTSPYPTLVNTTTMTLVSIGFVALSSANINVLTPNTTGQVVFCNNCIQSLLCISTGVAPGSVAAGSSWVTIVLSTNGATNTCH